MEFTILIGLSRRGSPTGGFLSLPYSFVSFRKVPYAYNISARNRHRHVTIHNPFFYMRTYVSVWNQIYATSGREGNHETHTRLIAVFRWQETRKAEARHQTHESSIGKTCRWQWCNLPRNSLVKNANYRCLSDLHGFPHRQSWEFFGIEFTQNHNLSTKTYLRWQLFYLQIISNDASPQNHFLII